MNIRVFNSDKNESYDFEVDNTTTMKNIKDRYAQKLGLEYDKLKVWISSSKYPEQKKEWIPLADHLTLAECDILIPEACAFIIMTYV
jgi:hypothetical protein